MRYADSFRIFSLGSDSLLEKGLELRQGVSFGTYRYRRSKQQRDTYLYVHLLEMVCGYSTHYVIEVSRVIKSGKQSLARNLFLMRTLMINRSLRGVIERPIETCLITQSNPVTLIPSIGTSIVLTTGSLFCIVFFTGFF